MEFKYLIGTETEPYRNLAIEQELMKSVKCGTAILYLWQNDNTIVVGRNQDVYSECRVDAFLEEGGYIARRHSGGGAVYHDTGNLNFSILCNATEEKFCGYQKILKDVLSEFGVKSEYNGKNDILVDGKKCSGNATYADGDRVCQHGTLLISTDIERMVSFLTPEKSKLVRNHVSSIASRVINLREFSGSINVESMKKMFIRITEASKLEYTPDKNRIDELTNFYKSQKWVYGGIR